MCAFLPILFYAPHYEIDRHYYCLFLTNSFNHRGTEVLAPHGVPVDLLDRMLIIRTIPYSLEEMVQIISIRASAEGLEVDEEALAAIGEVRRISVGDGGACPLVWL